MRFKLYHFVVAFFILNSISSFAQLTTKKHAVKLFNGDLKEGVRLTYEYPIMQSAYFQLDTKRYDSEDVAFFRNSHGFFANLAPYFGERSERYAMRIKNNGRVQLYEEINIEAYAGDTLLTQNPRRLASGQSWQFYTKDEGELRKCSFKSLKADLGDNPKSLGFLKNYRNLVIIQSGLAVVGAGIVGYEFYRQRNDDASVTPAMVLGVLCVGTTIFFESPKNDVLWMAVDNYK